MGISWTIGGLSLINMTDRYLRKLREQCHDVKLYQINTRHVKPIASFHFLTLVMGLFFLAALLAPWLLVPANTQGEKTDNDNLFLGLTGRRRSENSSWLNGSLFQNRDFKALACSCCNHRSLNPGTLTDLHRYKSTSIFLMYE